MSHEEEVIGFRFSVTDLSGLVPRPFFLRRFVASSLPV